MPSHVTVGRLVVVLCIAAAAVMGPAHAATAAASCPSLPARVGDLVALQRSPGPLGKAFPLGVTPMNEHALACFGLRELTLSAFVNEPGGIGGVTAFTITPSWIVSPSLIVFGSSREVSPGVGDGPFFFVSTPPERGDLQRRFARRWVTIRGHFDDSAATTCRASGPSGVTPSLAEAIAICRTMFVLTSIRTMEPPDTATVPVPAAPRPSATSASEWWITALAGLLVGLLVLLRRRGDDRPARRGIR